MSLIVLINIWQCWDMSRTFLCSYFVTRGFHCYDMVYEKILNDFAMIALFGKQILVSCLFACGCPIVQEG